MMEIGDTGYLLFDGDCGVCTYLATEIAPKIDSKHRFRIEPYRRFSEEELERFGLDYRKCNERVYTISPGGRVYGGAFAVNYFMLRSFPWSLLVLPFIVLPPLLLPEMLGYFLFSRNRHRISRWMGLTSCVVRR
jgi:predicted DCC family thiol-disulfide oxidoreductase YuxK